MPVDQYLLQDVSNEFPPSSPNFFVAFCSIFSTSLFVHSVDLSGLAAYLKNSLNFLLVITFYTYTCNCPISAF